MSLFDIFGRKKPKVPQWFKDWEAINQERHRELIMKLSALVSALEGIDTRLAEAGTEIVAEIQKLRDALGDVDIPAPAEAALTAIQTKANALADIVPNA